MKTSRQCAWWTSVALALTLALATATRADVPPTETAPAAAPAATAAQMLAEYQPLHRLELNPTNSFSVAFYDLVISNQLQRFLTQYPDSPNKAEIAGKLTQWQTERDQVAHGKIKMRGEWFRVADLVATRLQDSAALLKQYRYEDAFRKLQSATQIAADDLPQSIVVRKADVELSTPWLAVVQAKQEQLTNDMQNCEVRIAAAARAANDDIKTRADGALAASEMAKLKKELAINTRLLANVTEYASWSRTQLKVEQARLVVQEQQAQLALAIANRAPILPDVVPLQPKVVEKPVFPVEENLPAEQPKPAPPPPPPSRGFIRDNWLLMIIVVSSAGLTAFVFARNEARREQRR